jgi:hypothetical protein
MRKPDRKTVGKLEAENYEVPIAPLMECALFFVPSAFLYMDTHVFARALFFTEVLRFFFHRSQKSWSELLCLV